MKKYIISIIVLLLIFTLSFSYVFAAENSATSENMKSMMNGAENSVQNVTEDIGNGIKGGVQEIGNKAMDGLSMDNNYTATKTATESSNMFLGMDSTMFTWVIMAIVGLAIIWLVWMYARQHDESYND